MTITESGRIPHPGKSVWHFYRAGIQMPLPSIARQTLKHGLLGSISSRVSYKRCHRQAEKERATDGQV